MKDPTKALERGPPAQEPVKKADLAADRSRVAIPVPQGTEIDFDPRSM